MDVCVFFIMSKRLLGSYCGLLFFFCMQFKRISHYVNQRPSKSKKRGEKGKYL